ARPEATGGYAGRFAGATRQYALIEVTGSRLDLQSRCDRLSLCVREDPVGHLIGEALREFGRECEESLEGRTVQVFEQREHRSGAGEFSAELSGACFPEVRFLTECFQQRLSVRIGCLCSKEEAGDVRCGTKAEQTSGGDLPLQLANEDCLIDPVGDGSQLNQGPL
ncbi:MAG TPA: hypothetical protein VF381_09270, partial [Thermoanaerobaculia bacterium]